MCTRVLPRIQYRRSLPSSFLKSQNILFEKPIFDTHSVLFCLFPAVSTYTTHLETATRLWDQAIGFETAPASDDLKAHAGHLFYFYMAAGKTLKVKLRYRSRLSACAIDTEGRQSIKNFIMASDPEETQEPVLEHHPLDPLDTSIDHGNMGSLPPPAMHLTAAAMLSQRRQRRKSLSIKRSASTPNVRALANCDASMTLAEKKRNKLGYHRTSVACGMYSLPWHTVSGLPLNMTPQATVEGARSDACSHQMTLNNDVQIVYD